MKLLLLAAFLLGSIDGITQPCGASFNFQLGYPQGDMKHLTADPIGGGRINFDFKPIWQFPLYTGFELGYQRTLAKTSVFKGAAMGVYDLYKVKSSNRILSALATFRVSVPNEQALVRPFVEALVGGNRFRARVDVSKQSADGFDKVHYTNSRKGQWVFTYGGGAGIDIRLAASGNCFLELKAAYMEGARARYMTNPNTKPDGTVRFLYAKTTTDQFIPQAGVRFNFN